MPRNQRVAMREGTTLYYFLQDHLGSTPFTLNSSGVKVAETRYDVWGEPFWQNAPMHTNRLYTGQLWDGKAQGCISTTPATMTLRPKPILGRAMHAPMR